MDSSFVNYDGRSVHDMIEALLAMSGDPEAIRRLQESINAVDKRAQSSISIVNAAVEKLGDEVDVVANAGAKNLLPNRGAETTTTNGITFTKNADGSVTANGTATAEAVYYVVSNTTDDSVNFSPEYIMTGCPEGGDLTKYQLNYRVGKGSGSAYVDAAVDVGSGVRLFGFDSSTEHVNVNISIKSGQTVNNLVFRPMVRKAVITDDAYIPYGKTNAELSEDTGWLTLQSGIQYRKKDGTVYVHVEFPQADIPSGGASGWVGLNVGNQLPVGFRPSIVIRNAMGFRALADNQHKFTMGQINTVGGIQYNAHNIGVVDNTTFNSIVGDFSYPV